MRKERHEQEMQEKHNASVLQTIKELDQKIWKNIIRITMEKTNRLYSWLQYG